MRALHLAVVVATAAMTGSKSSDGLVVVVGIGGRRRCGCSWWEDE